MIHPFRYTFIVMLVVLSAANVNSQVPGDIFSRLQSNEEGQGAVRINQHSDISNLVALHVSLMRHNKGIKGFRVCIYYNSGQEARSGADQERAKFISRYEDVSSDKVFESPFWKVYVGSFRTKSEALNFLEKIRFDYPSAFIRDNITISIPQ